MWPETNQSEQVNFSTIYQVMLQLKPIGNYKGFWLLISVIEEIFKQKKIKYNLTKSIYPAVAEKYGCSERSIERCIRTLLLNIDMEILAEIAGVDIPDNITVSQIIDILVTYLIA